MLKVFGHLTSQPTRSLVWALKLKGLPYELIKADPMTGFDPEFTSKFPTRTIPAIEDGALRLAESHAILQFLASKHGWSDLYPADLTQRALVDQVLHWHHNNSRLLSGVLFRPFLFTVLLKGKLPDPPKPGDIKRLERAMTVLDGWLTASPFLAQQSRFTLADLVTYSEFDQIEALAARGFRLFDFAPYPSLTAWLARMRSIPHHDEVRKTLFKTAEMACSRANEIKQGTGAAKL